MSQDQNINSHCSTHVIRVFNHIAKGIGHCRNIPGRIIRISRHRPGSIGDRRQTPHSIIHPCGRIIPSIGLRYQPPIDIVIARLCHPGSIRFRDRYAIQRYPLLRIGHPPARSLLWSAPRPQWQASPPFHSRAHQWKSAPNPSVFVRLLIHYHNNN